MTRRNCRLCLEMRFLFFRGRGRCVNFRRSHRKEKTKRQILHMPEAGGREDSAGF